MARSSFMADLLSVRGLMYTLLSVGLVFMAFERPPEAVVTTQALPPVADVGAANSAQVSDIKTVKTSSFARLTSADCVRPAHPDRPSIQYALVIDAGSTGSRIHVYRFNYCRSAQPTLEDEIFEQLKPGLSSYTDANLAAASLKPLLDTAMKHVPESLRHCTPMTVKATAGLRMLKGDLGDKILTAIHDTITKSYPFPIIKRDGVVVMQGRDEGVYAWITVNYLLGKIGGGDRASTAAILDLGGGSTQIVFEPNMTMEKGKTDAVDLPSGDHRFDLVFGGIKYVLYQHSYDGYGLHAGRKAVLDATAKSANDVNPYPSPCIARGREKDTFDANTAVPSNVVGAASTADACIKFISTHMFDTSPGRCTHKAPLQPCSFDGVYMPSLKDTFPDNDMYAFSYFYDMFAYPFGSTLSFSVGDVRNAAQTVCHHGSVNTNTTTTSSSSTESQQPLLQLTEIGKKLVMDNAHWCMDLSFMHQLLSVGYGLPDTRVMRTAKKINGIETGWALGAAIQMLDALLAGGGKHGACLA